MSTIKLYLNEDIHIKLVKALRLRNIDVFSTQEYGKITSSDEEQLEFATKQQRTILTFNREDYIKLHLDWMKKGKNHYGIIISQQIPIGELLKRTLKLCNTLSSEDMRDRLEYLSQWK